MTETPEVSEALEQNLYDRIKAEFGLLTAGETGRLLGSRSSSASRNLATQTRRSGRLMAIERGKRPLYPGFQFDADGQPLPVIAELLQKGRDHGWSERGIVHWLCGPTTYLEGSRPVDLLVSDPQRVLDVAEQAWTAEW